MPKRTRYTGKFAVILSTCRERLLIGINYGNTRGGDWILSTSVRSVRNTEKGTEQTIMDLDLLWICDLVQI